MLNLLSKSHFYCNFWSVFNHCVFVSCLLDIWSFLKKIIHELNNAEEGFKECLVLWSESDEPEVGPPAANQDAAERLSLHRPASGCSSVPGGDTSDSDRINFQLYTLACLHHGNVSGRFCYELFKLLKQFLLINICWMRVFFRLHFQAR